MRDGFLPTEADVPEGTDLDLAVRVVELMLGHAVRDVRVEHPVNLGGTFPFIVLPHWPVRNLLIDGASTGRGSGIALDPDAGILSAGDRPARKVLVAYDVGYREGTVPAVISELIRWLARGGSESLAWGMADAARQLWASQIPDREHYGTRVQTSYVPNL